MIDIEVLLCRTIGCRSLFSRYWEWPHKWVCTPYTDWRYPYIKTLRKAYREDR